MSLCIKTDFRENRRPACRYASGIDNDIYTNTAFASVLDWASVAAKLLGEPDADRYSALAAQILIPFNATLDRHEE
jgi:hypothetical protein